MHHGARDVTSADDAPLGHARHNPIIKTSVIESDDAHIFRSSGVIFTQMTSDILNSIKENIEL